MEISRLEIAVHLFNEINVNQHGRPEQWSIKYMPWYSSGNEDDMIDKYRANVDVVSDNSSNHLIIIPMQNLSYGYMPDNLRKVYQHATIVMEDRVTLAKSRNLSSGDIAHILPNIDKTTEIGAWGEYTSGCVMYELLNLNQILGRSPTFNEALAMLYPTKGVDKPTLWPRRWQDMNAQELIKGQQNFYMNAKETYDQWKRQQCR